MDYRFYFSSFRSAFARAISSALNFFKRPKLVRYRLFLLIITAYLVVGLLLAIPIYSVKLDNDFTRTVERIFPYPAAIVDAGIVSLRALHKQEGFVLQFAGRTGQSLPQESPRQRVLDQLIENKLVAKAAAKQGFHLALSDVDQAYNKVIAENGGEKEVAKVLKNLYDMSLSDFKALVRAQLLKDKVQEDLLVRVKVRHMLVRDENRAKEVLGKARAGENWDELAKQFSEDTASRNKGGDLGFVGRGTLVKPFEEVAFGLKQGEIHPDLVKTDFGFHVVRVDERSKGKIDKSFDDFLKAQKEKTRIIKLVK